MDPNRSGLNWTVSTNQSKCKMTTLARYLNVQEGWGMEWAMARHFICDS